MSAPEPRSSESPMRAEPAIRSWRGPKRHRRYPAPRLGRWQDARDGSNLGEMTSGIRGGAAAMAVRPNRRPGPSALRLEPLPEVLQRLLALGQRELAQDFKGITR